MGRMAVVLGSSATGPQGDRIAAAATRHGAHVLQRHGSAEAGYRLPHRIDHAANMRALLEAGCDRVLGIGSVGSLK
jgi:purine nucleoside phosphorylase